MNLENEKKEFEDWAEKETNWDLYWSENINQYMDHQTNSAWLAWLASANREGYKLVPVEPTDIEIESIKEKHWGMRGCQLCKSDYIDLYKAMIGACDDH